MQPDSGLTRQTALSSLWAVFNYAGKGGDPMSSGMCKVSMDFGFINAVKVHL